MAQDQKQKLMIGVLAVLILGAGSYFAFFRDSGGAKVDQMSEGPAVRRVREAPKQDTNTVRKREEPRTRETAQPAERRVREEAEVDDAPVRRTRRSNDTEVKQKKVAPAA